MARAPSCSLTNSRLLHVMVTVGNVSSQEDILVEYKELWQLSTTSGALLWPPDDQKTPGTQTEAIKKKKRLDRRKKDVGGQCLSIKMHKYWLLRNPSKQIHTLCSAVLGLKQNSGFN